MCDAVCRTNQKSCVWDVYELIVNVVCDTVCEPIINAVYDAVCESFGNAVCELIGNAV